MSTVTLNRKQIEQLHQMSQRFGDVDLFTIESISSSGIGPTVTVRFDLFAPADTKIDITDVESW
jgi:hypothetical protein